MPATRLDRITVDPGLMGNRPCVRGLRLPVFRLLGLFAAGGGTAAIPAEDPHLDPEEIRAALAHAASLDGDSPVGFGR